MAKKDQAQAGDVPLWRANEKSYVGLSLVDEGTENIAYSPPEGGEVAANLSPMNDAAQAIVDGQKSEHPDKSKGKAKAAPADAGGADTQSGAGDIA